MDEKHFDKVTRALVPDSSRRTVLGLLFGGFLATLSRTEGEGKKRGKGKKKRARCGNCGPCQSCQGGQCTAKANGTACGACRTCRGGRCVSECEGGKTCQGGACACPAGTKDCQGTCIPNDQCCAGNCPQNLTCCGNVNQCKDVRNDSAFCGQCANGQCPGGAFCANGACGLTCTLGQPCFTGCACGTRVDPAHDGQTVCSEISGGTCDAATECATDADCAPGTLGFRQVCVSDLCPPFNVCADPCA